MNEQPRVSIRANTTGKIISVIPRLLGFQPAQSDMIVLGVGDDDGRARVRFAARFGIIDRGAAPEAADAARAVLSKHGMPGAVLVGYGPGPVVTPVMDAFRSSMAQGGIAVGDAVRVDEGRYWSYLDTNPDAPAEGTPLEADSVDAGTLDRVGQAQPSRADFAASIGPLTGEQAEAQRQIAATVAREHEEQLAHGDDDGTYRAGVGTVDQALAAARAGAPVSAEDHARLSQYMTDVRVRDAAWSRLDREHAEEHKQMLTETVRRAQPGTVAAPASLLAFTAGQRGQGALANVALDRALEDDPAYSMAHLLGNMFDAGMPPEMFASPMSPAEIDEAYGFGATTPEAAPAPVDREAGE
jgi:hypothetical protein